MQIITAIEELDKKRCKIYLDGEFAFVLYKGELSIYGIQVNKELSREEYSKILGENLTKRAKKRALYLLQKKSYTEWKLREKLREGYYPSEVIDEAINYVKSYHYIDDLSFAKEYIFFRKETLPKRILEEKLRQKGIGKEDLQKALEEFYDSREEEEELQMKQALKLLKKRSYDKEIADPKEKQKLYAYLMRKGISSSVIKKALAIEWEE